MFTLRALGYRFIQRTEAFSCVFRGRCTCTWSQLLSRPLAAACEHVADEGFFALSGRPSDDAIILDENGPSITRQMRSSMHLSFCVNAYFARLALTQLSRRVVGLRINVCQSRFSRWQKRLFFFSSNGNEGVQTWQRVERRRSSSRRRAARKQRADDSTSASRTLMNINEHDVKRRHVENDAPSRWLRLKSTEETQRKARPNYSFI